jgi:hypothetical protein
MTIGTFLRSKFCLGLGAEMMDNFENCVPEGRMLMMRKIFPNLVTWSEFHKICMPRWMCFSQAFQALKGKYGTFKLEAARTFKTDKGLTVESDFMSFIPNAEAKNLDKIDLETTDSLITVDDVLISGNPGWLLSASACMDVRMGMQCSDVRQNKKDEKFMKDLVNEISQHMVSIIFLAGKKDLLNGIKEFNLSPESKFCQAYFQAKSFCAATLRGINFTLYGSAGGADTRSRVTHLSAKVNLSAGIGEIQ